MTNDTRLTIRRRPLAELMAHYQGQIAAYDLILKMWPVTPEEIESFAAISRGLMESQRSEYRNNE